MVSELQSGHDHIAKSIIFNFKGPYFQKYAIQSYGSCALYVVSLLYICVKFHENISNGFRLTERTRFCDRQTDRQTNPGKTICLQTLNGVDIIIITLFQEDNIFCMNISLTYVPQLQRLTCHWTSINYLQYVQSMWGFRIPSMLRVGYPTLLTWRKGTISRLKTSRWLPQVVRE